MSWLSTIRIDSGEQLQEYINMFKLNIVRAQYDERHRHLDLLLLSRTPYLDHASHPSHGHSTYHPCCMV